MKIYFLPFEENFPPKSNVVIDYPGTPEQLRDQITSNAALVEAQRKTIAQLESDCKYWQDRFKVVYLENSRNTAESSLNASLDSMSDSLKRISKILGRD